MTNASKPGSLTGEHVRLIRLAGEDDYEGWRDAARRLSSNRVPPGGVVWRTDASPADLLALESKEGIADMPASELRVPRAFPSLAQSAILHSSPDRFALLYELLWRLGRERHLLEDAADPLVRKVETLAKAVRRDMHKMRAFVRFQEIDDRFIAWFEPDHHIVRANAGFFVRRFAQLRWSILTPAISIHWDGENLHEGPGADRSKVPHGDPLEEMWKAYYGAIFNPARLKVSAMTREMPRRYWKNLPEAELIAPLIADAHARESRMVAQSVDPKARPATLAALAREAQGCRRCPLWKGTNGCVFGEGPSDARIMVVGEQPGDEEDLAQKPFVGPSGEVLNRALDEAGVDRTQVYVTNAVKHFKYIWRGKRRLHQTPAAGEIDACKWWLDQEIGLIRPASIVMLGASAIRGVTGRPGSIGKLRGAPVHLEHGQAFATYHPAYILRQPDPDASRAAYSSLVADIELAASAAQ